MGVYTYKSLGETPILKIETILGTQRNSYSFNSEEWVKALERKKEYVLRPVIDRRVTDRRNGEQRLVVRRLAKRHIRNNTVLIKEEIDYSFKLLSKRSKVKATIDL